MSGLVIKLSPHERILINGAVIQNGGKRGKISILSRDVKILRLKDAIHPEDTNTPIKKIISIAQLALSGDDDFFRIKNTLIESIDQIRHIFKRKEDQEVLIKALHHIQMDEPYQTLKALKFLLAAEAEMRGDA